MSSVRTRIAEANNDFELDLLRSWDTEQPTERARELALGVLGASLAASAVTSTSVSGAGTLGVAGGSIAPKATSFGVLVAAKWLAVGAVAAGAVGVTMTYRRPSPPPADPSRPVATPTLVAEAPAPTAVDTRAIPAPIARVPEPVPPAQSSSADLARERVRLPAGGSARKPASLGLGDQVAALGEAESKLASGDAAEALRLVEEYDRQFPGGLLAEEAAAIRIEALVAQGDREKASLLAARFVAANPSSPHSLRIRRLLDGPGVLIPASGGPKTP